MEAGRFEVTPHACFACGELNEHGLHLILHVAEDTCWTDLTLGPSFQGWEGIAHGGILATILDEVMGWALASQDAWGYTAKMSIEYRRPVPIGLPVRGEGKVVERRRRLLTTSARILDPRSGELFVTAEGLYVAAPEARREELKARYGFRLLPDDRQAPDPGAQHATPGQAPAAGDGSGTAPRRGRSPRQGTEPALGQAPSAGDASAAGDGPAESGDQVTAARHPSEGGAS